MNNTSRHIRQPMPAQFCNLDRLLFSMEQRGIDGLVVSTANNMFYLSGFAAIAHKSDEPRPYSIVLSRHQPDHPIVIVGDYYLGTMLAQPSWIKDIRTFRAVMMPLDLPPAHDDVDRFVPAKHLGNVPAIRDAHSVSFTQACERALIDLNLRDATVAFDDLRIGHQMAGDTMRVRDAYDPLMYARAVKTAPELKKLKAATRVNQQAISSTVAAWSKGMTLRDFNHHYHMAATDLGGFVRDPGGMVWAHPQGSDEVMSLDSGFDDFELTAGINLMFDCHGTLDMYCWDGGKTWTIDGEPQGDGARNAKATAVVAETVISNMKPGVKVSELQAMGRETFRKAGVPNADQGIVFFHGLGLSHMDIEQTKADGSANGDWVLEKDMVVPLHIFYPGDESSRSWVEEIAHVKNDGGEALFTWGFGPITQR